MTFEDVLSVSCLDEETLRFIRTLIGVAPGRESSDPGEFMQVLVYGVLFKSGFSKECCISVLTHYKELLKTCGEMYAADKAKDAPAHVLQLIDNRYSILGSEPETKAFDFREQVEKASLPPPVLSLAVALPELFVRSYAGLRDSRRERSTAARKQFG